MLICRAFLPICLFCILHKNKLMALIQLGALVTKISGKVGGQSFAHGPSGSYIKNVGSYIRTKSTMAQRVKNYLAIVTGSYSNLSKADITTWSIYAQNFPYTNRVGVVVYHSAYAMYVKTNYNRLLLQLPPIQAAPPLSTDSQVVNLTLTSSLLKVNMQLMNTSANVKVKIFCSPPLAKNNNQYRGKMRLLTMAPSTQYASSFSITTEIKNMYGPLKENDHYFIQVFSLDNTTGQVLGTFLIQDVLVSAL